MPKETSETVRCQNGTATVQVKYSGREYVVLIDINTTEGYPLELDVESARKLRRILKHAYRSIEGD